jgi:putative transposase
MDAKGRSVDNRMIETLWRSLKYECIYLSAFETGSETRHGIGKSKAYYNAERPHSTHGILAPDEAYDRKMEPMRSAA